MLSVHVGQPKTELPSISTRLILFGDVVMNLGQDEGIRGLVSGPLAIAIEDLHSNETELFRLNGELVLNDADLDDLASGLVLRASTIPRFRSCVLSFTLEN
jgi:hypothetical protein